MPGKSGTDLENRLARLEAQVETLQDRLAIYQLLAIYAPAVDSRSRAATAALWCEDGEYDFGGTPLKGADEVGSLVDLETHIGYVERGCAHVMSVPMVHLQGERAAATGYSRVYLRDGDGFKVERASANRWELEKRDGRWRVRKRINRLIGGSGEARELLARGLAEVRSERD